MWTTPLVVSILARWLPSSTSSTMSGWSPSASPTCFACAWVGATRSTQTAASGWRSSSGSRASAVGPSHSRAVSPSTATTRIVPGCPADPWRPGAGRARRAGRRTRVRGRGRVLGVRGHRVGLRRSLGRVRAAVSVIQHTCRSRRPAAEGQARRDGHRGHRGRDEEQPDHDRGGLARRPALERADDERVTQRPVAERLGDELAVGVGRRVDLDVRRSMVVEP